MVYPLSICSELLTGFSTSILCQAPLQMDCTCLRTKLEMASTGHRHLQDLPPFVGHTAVPTVYCPQYVTADFIYKPARLTSLWHDGAASVIVACLTPKETSTAHVVAYLKH